MALFLGPTLLGLAGLVVGLVVGEWVGGFVSGAAIVGAVAVPIYLLSTVTGAAPRSMGAFAEQQVSDALRQGLAKPCVSFDHVAFKGWDVDHLVLSESRALAIESKWSADPWDLADGSDERLVRAARQVTRSLRSLRIFLRSTQIGLALEVEPLVVVVGQIQSGATEGSIGGVPAVHVRDLKQWVAAWSRGRDHALLTVDELNEGSRRIVDYLDLRDEHDARAGSEPFFVLHGALKPMQAIYDAFLGFVLGMWLPSLAGFALLRTGWFWLGMAGTLAVAGVGPVVLRRLGRRSAAAGWVAGLVGLVVWIAVVLASSP